MNAEPHMYDKSRDPPFIMPTTADVFMMTRVMKCGESPPSGCGFFEFVVGVN
jgi:hypothetical protein